MRPFGLEGPRERGPEGPGAGGEGPGAPSVRLPGQAGQGLNGRGERSWRVQDPPQGRGRSPPRGGREAAGAPRGCRGHGGLGTAGTPSRGAGDASGPAVTLSGSRTELCRCSLPQSTAELLWPGIGGGGFTWGWDRGAPAPGRGCWGGQCCHQSAAATSLTEPQLCRELRLSAGLG